MGSELERLGYPRERNSGVLWGTRALYDAPDLVGAVHRSYVRAGADVITTNTWQIASMPAAERAGLVDAGRGGWRAQARRGVECARAAVFEERREGRVAVAFSLSRRCLEASFAAELLRAIEGVPPDLFLVETLIESPTSAQLKVFELLVATGIPVWLAYRRCVEGACDVHGTIVARDWGPFARAADALESIGIAVLLVNCLPIELVEGTLALLRTVTRLPIGVFPNLGRFVEPGWQFDACWGPQEFADAALRWRDEEGAQIVGGCCGVTAEHIGAARAALSDSTRAR